MSADALKPQIITDPDAQTPVPDETRRIVAEGEAKGFVPISAPRPSSAMDPRAHIPQYAGKMRGELPDKHPTRLRQIAEYKAMRRREAKRDAAVLAAEAAVAQKLKVGTHVVIGSNAKVDYEDTDGTRVSGHYGGIEGEIYQTYVDHEGVRRHIVVSRDTEAGKSHYAPVAVRECDLTPLGRRESGGRRFHAVPVTAQVRAGRKAAEAERRSNMTQEELERAAFGGRTADELARLMSGL